MLEAAMRTVLRTFKQNIMENTVVGTQQDIVEIASLPVLVLFTPEITIRRYDDANDTYITKDLEKGTSKLLPAPGYYDLTFEYEFITEKALDLLKYEQQLLALFQITPYIEVEGTQYPVIFHGNKQRTTELDTKEGIRRSAGTFTIEGVEIQANKPKEGKLVQGTSFSLYKKQNEVNTNGKTEK